VFIRSIQAAFWTLAVAGLAGCVSAPSLQGVRPTPSQNQKYGLAKSGFVATTNHMTQHLNADQSVVYFQNQGGGGVGLGLLLGPIGVAANMKMIEGVTTADVEKLKGKIPLNPEMAFQRAAFVANFPVQASANESDVKIAPYVLVSKTNESTVHISSIVLFEGMDGQTKWLRRYQYQLPGKYTLDELAAFDAMKASAVQTASVNAYTALLKHVAEETDASIVKEQKITFKSPYLSPRFEFEMTGSLIGANEGRVWVRTAFGVIAVDPSDIRYEITKN